MKITTKRTPTNGIQIFANGEYITSVSYKPKHEAFIKQITKANEVKQTESNCNIQHIARELTCSCGKPDAIRLCEGVEYCMKCGDKLSK